MIKKNNKGFTLIEIIAVVALLGILGVIAIPRIFDMVNNNRNSVYIQDAIRLIAKAQFTMNEKSVKIEKPDNDEVIVFSMKYLSTSDFQNPPNGGTYLTESSFVLVKNINGEYVYSAMLVEQTKKGYYMGVELSTESALNAKDAIKHVRLFKEDEIAYFDESTSSINGGLFINSAFINDFIKLGEDDDENDWELDDDDIIGYYNNEGESEEDVQDTNSPKIQAKFSVSGSLQTVLNITAKDADSEVSQLKVFLKISHSKTDSYPNVDSDPYEYYGSENVYTKNINFADYGFSYTNRETAYVYIAVADDTGNVTHKKLSYDVHENEKPNIIDYKITNIPGNAQNMPKARVYLDVKDDMDAKGDLQVCFTQSVTANAASCSNYKSYASYFGTSGYYDYTFKDDNGNDITIPDGSSHDLKVFVRDSMGLNSNSIVTYSIYKNNPPVINSFSFNKKCYVDSSGSCVNNKYSLTVGINISIDEDLSSNDKVNIEFYQLDAQGRKKLPISTNYERIISNGQEYIFDGDYDGVSRKLYVEVTDEYGAKTTSDLVLDHVYKDQPPTISLITEGSTEVPFITSLVAPCSGASSCTDSSYGGNYKTKLNFNLDDDITDVNDIKVCVSETENDCSESNKNSNNFVKYSAFSSSYEFEPNSDLGEMIYNGDEKSLYFAAVDGKGNWIGYNNYQPITYKVYKNQKPKVSGNYTVSSVSDKNIYAIKVNLENLNIVDDFNDYQAKFCYTAGNEAEQCSDYKDYSALADELSTYYELMGADGKHVRHLGQDVSFKIKIKDNYNDSCVTSDNPEYELYQDQVPVIKSSSVVSSTEDYENFIFYLSFEVVDYEDEYSVCVSNNSSCSGGQFLEDVFTGLNSASDGTDNNNETPGVTVNGSDTLGWSSTYQDPDNNKTFYLVVKDSYDNVVNKELHYTTYKLCSNPDYMIDTGEEPTYTIKTGQAISPAYCGGKCYHNITDRSGNNVTNTIFGLYEKKTNFMDTLVGDETSSNKCSVSEETSLYCDYVDCFDTGHDTNSNLISLNLEEPTTKWYYSNTHVKRKVLKPYCENLDGESYFSPYDVRCESAGVSYCADYANTACQDDINQYNNALQTYEQNAITNMKQELVLKFASLQDTIYMCAPYSYHIDDEIVTNGKSAWLNYYENYCNSNSGNSPEICNAISHKTECDALEDEVDNNDVTFKTNRQSIIADYASHNPPPVESDCYDTKLQQCNSFYSFCSANLTTYQKEVSCSDKHDLGPYYCKIDDYTRGICKQNNCTEGSTGCVKVCYKTYDCTSQYEMRPVTFTCNGYYKTYKSTKVGDNIILQETPLRVCPDFMEAYPSFYNFDGSSNNPFIKFNSDEIGVMQVEG